MSIETLRPELKWPAFPLKSHKELEHALQKARDEYEKQADAIFEKFIDHETFKRDQEMLAAVNEFTRLHFPITAPAAHKIVIQFAVDDMLVIIGGIMPRHDYFLRRIFEPGLYHRLGAFENVSENRFNSTEEFSKFLGDYGARETVFEALSKILQESPRPA